MGKIFDSGVSLKSRKGLPEKRRKKLLDPKTWERDGRLVEVATMLRSALGDGLFEDHNIFRDRVDAALKDAGTKVPAAELKLIVKAVSWRVESAAPVMAKVHKPGRLTADPMLGLYDAVIAGKACVVEYEPDADLRDTEQVPLLEEGGIEALIRREVLGSGHFRGHQSTQRGQARQFDPVDPRSHHKLVSRNLANQGLARDRSKFDVHVVDVHDGWPSGRPLP